MDALTKIIALASIEGTLDLRCQMAGVFDIPHEQLGAGEAPFHFVLSGSTRLTLPDTRVLDLRAGDFVLLPRGMSHSLRGASKGRAAKAHMHRSGPLLERRNTSGPVDVDILCGRFLYAPGAGDLVMSTLPDVLHVSLAKEESFDALPAIVSLLRDEVKNLRSGALSIVTSLSSVLFVMALRLYASREGMAPSLLVLLSDSRLSSAVLAMMKEPEKSWTVETLAKQVNMSRATFARHFSARGAQSPLDLLTTVRVGLAAELLKSSHLPVGEIAERVGYRSESAFGKVFQKRVGLTPFGYRRRHSA